VFVYVCLCVWGEVCVYVWGGYVWVKVSITTLLLTSYGIETNYNISCFLSESHIAMYVFNNYCDKS
jgi:hypothetical protein